MTTRAVLLFAHHHHLELYRENEMTLKTTSAENVASYTALMPLIEALFREFQDLSKKKPDSVLNSRKTSIVNTVLSDVLQLLNDQPSRRYLNLIDDDDLPQNSDVVVVLGQAVAAMKTFRAEHHGSSRYSHGWHVD